MYINAIRCTSERADGVLVVAGEIIRHTGTYLVAILSPTW